MRTHLNNLNCINKYKIKMRARTHFYKITKNKIHLHFFESSAFFEDWVQISWIAINELINERKY